jgi:hypothetical protein
MHFYSGPPMDFLSGVDMCSRLLESQHWTGSVESINEQVDELDDPNLSNPGQLVRCAAVAA